MDDGRVVARTGRQRHSGRDRHCGLARPGLSRPPRAARGTWPAIAIEGRPIPTPPLPAPSRSPMDHFRPRQCLGEERHLVRVRVGVERATSSRGPPRGPGSLMCKKIPAAILRRRTEMWTQSHVDIAQSSSKGSSQIASFGDAKVREGEEIWSGIAARTLKVEWILSSEDAAETDIRRWPLSPKRGRSFSKIKLHLC